jgi:tetratricopeptide (TPR) repeat protein
MSGTSPLIPANAVGPAAVRRPASAHSPGTDLAPEMFATVASSDPNESFELREMVNVATAYFDQGMLEDAEELLHEARAAGYSRSDADRLEQRIHHLRGNVSPSVTPSAPAPLSVVRHGVEFPFTRSLPAIDRQAHAVQRAALDADMDLLAGRIESAVDAALHTIALAPRFTPAFVRLAEVRVALGDTEGAADLIETLERYIQLRASDESWLLQPVKMALNPNDRSSMVEYARAALSKPGTTQLEPHVPDAIANSLHEDPQTALELATLYVRVRPGQAAALRLFLQACTALDDRDQAIQAIVHEVHTDSEADLLFLRAAVAAETSQAEWLQWLERAVRRLTAHAGEYQYVAEALVIAIRIATTDQLALSASIVHIAAGQAEPAHQAALKWIEAARTRRPDPKLTFLCACALSHALAIGKRPEAISAFARAAAESVVTDMVEFANTCFLFPRAVSCTALLADLCTLARDTAALPEAVRQLQWLRDRFPRNLDIRDALARMYIETGETANGLRELRAIAEQAERTGDHARTSDAMRRISAALPNNIDAKSKLVELFLQRGVLDEASRELRALGDLHVKRGNVVDAVAALTRGAEIAMTIGDIGTGGELYELAAQADPNNDAIRHAAVAFYLQVGAVEPAARQLWEVVRIALNAKDPDEAVAALHQIIALTPADPSAYHRLGEVLSTMGEYKQAERVYHRLATLTPDDPVLAAKQSALAALASA